MYYCTLSTSILRFPCMKMFATGWSEHKEITQITSYLSDSRSSCHDSTSQMLESQSSLFLSEMPSNTEDISRKRETVGRKAQVPPAPPAEGPAPPRRSSLAPPPRPLPARRLAGERRELGGSAEQEREKFHRRGLEAICRRRLCLLACFPY